MDGSEVRAYLLKLVRYILLETGIKFIDLAWNNSLPDICPNLHFNFKNVSYIKVLHKKGSLVHQFFLIYPSVSLTELEIAGARMSFEHMFTLFLESLEF